MKYYFYKYSETDIEKQRALARCLFRYALEKDYGITGVDYIKGERGKPYIPNSNLHMSLSHCRACIACIIANEPVGIDVEEISRMNLKFARRICTPSELELFNARDDVLGVPKEEFLCRLWVMKEAYSKLTGKGFSQGFSTINTIENKQLYAIKHEDVYIGIATSSSDLPQEGSCPSLL